MNPYSFLRAPLRASPLFLLVLLPIVPASAQTTWKATGTGDFTLATNWNNGVPISATDAAITNGVSLTPTIVNLTGAYGYVAGLKIGSFDTLNINLGSILYVDGPSVTNNGAINVFGGAANTFLLVDSPNLTLQGGGTVTLSSAPGGFSAYIQGAATGLTLTNVDNTIQGAGIIGNTGLAIVNQIGGTINANVKDQALNFQGTGGITNANLIEATNGGILNLKGSTVNNAGGNLTADGAGSALHLSNSVTIIGGTLNAINGGTMGSDAGNGVSLDGSTAAGGITLKGDYLSDLGSITYIAGTLDHSGNLQLNGGAGNNTILVVNSPNLTLQGGGTVTLSTAAGGGSAYIQSAVGGWTLTNVDNTIQGAGIIGNTGLAIVNQAHGTINANVTGQALDFQGTGGITNANLIEATNGGILNLNGGTVNNAGGNLTADGAGSALHLSNSVTIIGGTLNAIHGGTMGSDAGTSVSLDGSTAAGGITLKGDYLSDLGSYTYIAGTLDHGGDLQLKGGAGTNTVLMVDSPNLTLQGGGTVTLSTAPGGGSAYIQQLAADSTLTNVDNTIQGAGIIGNNGLAIVNKAGGTINANVTGQALNFQGTGGVTNANLIEATSGGILNFVGGTVNNAGGNLTADGAGSALRLSQAVTIIGGTLNAIHGGTMGSDAGTSVSLDGSTAAGRITLKGDYLGDLGSYTYIAGTLDHSGDLQLKGGAGTNTVLMVNSPNLTLQGGGTVTLSTAVANGGSAYIQQVAAGSTLTNVDNTIQGAGIIGNNGLSLLNGVAGTVVADASGQTLLINGSGTVTNNGTLQANAGSTLQTTATLTNFSGNTLTGGTYVVNGSPSATGTLQFNLGDNAGGEIVNNAAAIVLNGPNANTRFVDSNGNNALSNLAANTTASSSLTVSGGYNFTTPGAFANSGTVHAANGGTFTASNGITGPTGTVQIDAGGTVSLAGGNTPSTVGTLNQNGSLVLGSNNVTVSTAYNNSNFGVGNSFNKHAGVTTGTGQILAAGDTKLSISGSAIGGTTAAPTLAIGNVHVGDSKTLTYSISNSGTTGPSVQGAIQTAVNGGNITDSRLSGSGVTAGNFGPLTNGQSTTPYSVTFTASTAGALAAGQKVNVASNFDNVAGPTLTLGGGAAYQLAQASVLPASPISLGNTRIGGTLNQSLNITNSAPNTGGYTETLGGSVTGTSGQATGTGTISGVVQGASGNGISVGLNTGTAGAVGGNVTLGFTSSAVNNSGLGTTTLPGSQTVALTGAVYQAAQGSAPSPVNVGNFHVSTGSNSVSVNVSNVAPNTNGYTETLGATVSGATGGVTTSGSISGLAQGASSNAINVSLNSGTAGAVSGTTTLAYTTSAVNNSGLGTIGAGSQTVNVTGNAFNLASANLGTINFGKVLVGSSAAQFLSVTNSAPVGAFSEGLDATLGAFNGTGASLLSGSGSIINLAAGATSTNGLNVALNTGSAGTVAATVQVNLASNGAGTSGLGLTQLAPQSAAINGEVDLVAQVGNLASASQVSPNPVNLGNVHVGTASPTRALTISNTLVGPGEGLNASISTASSGLTATGSFTSLQGGNTDSSSLVVGMNTSTAGSKNGTATIALASDGTYNQGVTTALPAQNVAVTGAVYQLAQANTLPTSINLGNVRVGGSLGQTLNVKNAASDTGGYTETLGATAVGSGGASTTGSITGLAAGTSSNAISVNLNTASAGALSGSATVSYSSQAVNNSALGTTGLDSKTVNVTGAAYQAAQGSALPTAVNLGTVRTGTVVNTALTVSNVAPLTGGYTENLGASFGATTSGLTGAGTITGLAAGAPASNALSVQYTAGAAGSYSGSAAVNFQTEAVNNSGLATAQVGSQTVDFSGTVNAIANSELTHTGSYGFTSTGLNSGTLNFGTLTLGSGTVQDVFALLNNLTGPADFLTGTIDVSNLVGGPFGFGGSSSFDLGAQQSSAFDITFNTDATTGFFTATLDINEASHNAYQNDLALTGYDLTIEGTINPAGTNNVPDAGATSLLLGLGLAGLALARRWKCQPA